MTLPNCYHCEFTDQYGLYDGSWKGLIVDEAFAHPAKFSRGLICWIVEHGMVAGCWAKGDLIGDPFAGVGTGGIIAASNGLRWIGVELEPRFVELARQNFSLHRRTWEGFGDPQPVIVLGDSRRFAGIVGEVAGVVTSPPFASQVIHDRNGIDLSRCERAGPHSQAGALGYGHAPGQIGSLPTGNLDAAITSPPYAHTDTKPTKMGKGRGTRVTGESADRNKGDYLYPESDGQIGALKEGELDAVVTSPPWENSGANLGDVADTPGVRQEINNRSHKRDDAYGQTPGQLGTASGQTYWQAVAEVYRQVHLAMKPGGVIAVVCKDYVKNKQRVPLCDDTCKLLESLGFHVFERTRAWLVKESTHPDLFGGEDHVTRTERKSFFRRLAEKRGSPRIDWEEVIWARRLDQEVLFTPETEAT